MFFGAFSGEAPRIFLNKDAQGKRLETYFRRRRAATGEYGCFDCIATGGSDVPR